jgi:hypothetical protein
MHRVSSPKGREVKAWRGRSSCWMYGTAPSETSTTGGELALVNTPPER